MSGPVYITDLSEEDALALQETRDEGLSPHRRGRHIGRGRHVDMPEVWDGRGDVPPGWTGESGVYEQWEWVKEKQPNPDPPPPQIQVKVYRPTGEFNINYPERAMGRLDSSRASQRAKDRVTEIHGRPPAARPPKPPGPPPHANKPRRDDRAEPRGRNA